MREAEKPGRGAGLLLFSEPATATRSKFLHEKEPKKKKPR